MKKILSIVLCAILLFSLSGCAAIESKINDIRGKLVGNNYDVYTYDNFGNLVLSTSGEKINISANKTATTSYDSEGSVIRGSELTSVITITIDGSEIQSCGDTCIFVQDGLTPEVEFASEEIVSKSEGIISDSASIARFINQYKNLFGKSRVVVIKSQLGQPIAAYSGDDVYWEIPKNLPKMTKLMIDGKALYIHRANFQIIDKELLQEGN
jgi:hypothetical protein